MGTTPITTNNLAPRKVLEPSKKYKTDKDLPKATIWDKVDEAVMHELKDAEKVGPQQLLKVFTKYKDHISNFAYWYMLGICWVRCRKANLDGEFGKLFLSDRIDRVDSIMKPSEKSKFMEFLQSSKIRVFWPEIKNKPVISYAPSHNAVIKLCERLGCDAYFEAYVENDGSLIAYFNRVGVKELIIPNPISLKTDDPPLFSPKKHYLPMNEN